MIGATYNIPTGPATYETVVCKEVAKDGRPMVTLSDGRRLIGTYCSLGLLWHLLEHDPEWLSRVRGD